MASIYGEYINYTRLRLDYSMSQDTENNKTTINMSLYAERTKGSSQYNQTGNSYWNLSGTGNTIINYNWVSSSLELYLGSTSIVIPHNDDGTGSVILSGYWYTDRTGSNYIPKELSVSAGITLPTIPRASTITGGSGNIGYLTTISITSASTSFTHTLRYSFGNLSGTIATGVTTSYDWTIPTDFYTEIPNAPSDTGIIYCDTYSANTLIGTKSTPFTATAKEKDCKPQVSGTITDINQKTLALTGNENTLIKNRSTAQITIEAIAKNSAYITNKTINNISLTGNVLEIVDVSDTTFNLYAIDSRKYDNTDTLTPTIIPYVPLTIKAKFYRPQATTGEVSLTYSGKCFSNSFGAVDNSIEIIWKYKEENAEEWIDGGVLVPELQDNKIKETTISLGTTFDYKKTYVFQLIAKDLLDTFTINNAKVSAGEPVFCWGKDFFNVNVELQWFGKNLLSLIFPVGSIYITQEDINPETILGFGKWERSKGRVLVGLDEDDDNFNSIGKTGGKTTHTLTRTEMPIHNHAGLYWYGEYGMAVDTGGGTNRFQMYQDGLDTTVTQIKTGNTGGSQAHNNLQPYEVVGYVWIRRT